MVKAFYQAVLLDRDPTVIDQYIGDTYIQHNPWVEDGKEAFRRFIENLPKTKNPPGEIVRVIAQGDLVMLHVKMYPQLKNHGTAIVDIFRVEDGKIVEHWDVMQSVPSQSANSNTMF